MSSVDKMDKGFAELAVDMEVKEIRRVEDCSRCGSLSQFNR